VNPVAGFRGAARTKLTIRLYLEENSHYGDPDERRCVAEFATQQAALSAARDHLDSNLRQLWSAGNSAQQLLEKWSLFGEDVFLVPESADSHFCAWDYARQRCQELCCIESQ
jgi:hypothetical protein